MYFKVTARTDPQCNNLNDDGSSFGQFYKTQGCWFYFYFLKSVLAFGPHNNELAVEKAVEKAVDL